MANPNMKVEVKGPNLVITIPIEDRVPSSTGKSLRVASSNGNIETSAVVDGKKVIVGLNAYIKP